MMSIEVIGGTKSDQLPTKPYWTDYLDSVYHGYTEITIPLKVFFDTSSHCPPLSGCGVKRINLDGTRENDAGDYGLTYSSNNLVINEANSTSKNK